MQRSKLVLGFVVALAVGGLGAAAVAAEGDTGGGSLEGTTTSTVDPSTTTSTTAVPTTTVAPVVDPAAPTSDVTGDPAGDGGVARSTDGCDGGTYANHGDYVSSVAHDADRAPGDVAAAAQSDCGMPLSAVGDNSPEAPETEAPESDAPTDSSGPGNGNGNGHSK